MPTRKTKARVGLGIVIAAFLSAMMLVGAILYFQAKTDLQPSPGIEQGDGFPIVDWDYWLSINPDIIGWVTMPDTNINTAIVQARPEHPQRYLTHDLWGNWNPWGAVYLTADCIKDGLESTNSVIYGHNMGYGNDAQFTDIAKYSEHSYATEHSVILLQTPEQKKKLSVRFSEIVPGWERIKRTAFADKHDYQSWYRERFTNATVALSEDGLAPENNYSFVACSYNYWSSERTVVYAANGKE